jgi:hypothetical protein
MGQSLFKGIKLNGEIVTQQIEGYKQNGEQKDGFWLNGNWYEPGAFECTLTTFSSSYYSGGVTFYLADGETTATYYADGVEYTVTSSTAGGSVTVGKGSNGIESGAVLKIYDKNIEGVKLNYSASSRNSKGNITYSNSPSVDSIAHYGQYMTMLPKFNSDMDALSTTRPSNIPCNFTTTDKYSFTWGISILTSNKLTQLSIIPSSLSDSTIVKTGDDYSTITPYSFLWQAANNPNNPLTSLVIAGTYVNSSIAFDKSIIKQAYLVPISITELKTSTELSYGFETATTNTRFFTRISFTGTEKLIEPRIYVFWDKNGYIKGDISKPVTNYIGIAWTGDNKVNTDSDGNVTSVDMYPIIKYWGEWTKQDLIDDGYDMNMIDGRYPLPE